MGKPQGDGLAEPVYYHREVDGETVSRPAYTPADHVNLQAHGWTKSEKNETTERPAAHEPVADEKRAGSRERAQARVVPAPAAGAEGEGSNA